jgi:hypothetical protein
MRIEMSQRGIEKNSLSWRKKTIEIITAKIKSGAPTKPNQKPEYII